MNSEIYIIDIIKKIKITNPKQQAFVAGPKYRAQNARHKQGVQSIGVPFFFLLSGLIYENKCLFSLP